MNVLPIYKVRLQTHIYKVIRLVHLLSTLAAAAHKALLQIIFMHAELLHPAQQLIALLRRNRQGERKGCRFNRFPPHR